MNLPELKDGEKIIIQTPPAEAAPLTVLDWCKVAMQEYTTGAFDTETRMEQLRGLLHWLGLDY